MDRKVIRILLVDDDEDDFLLTKALCQRIHHAQIQLEWASSFEAGERRIADNAHDVVLVDYRLGARDGLELLREVVPFCVAPCILLTGQGGHEIDMEAMRAGASDYLVKDELSAPLLERAVRYAIERKRGEERLNRLALYDPLTGLPNRVLLRDRLSQELSRASRYGSGVALLFLDLDRFKTVNDSLGHDAGDELLRVCAGRLGRCARKIDTVARISGDEFVMILSAVPTADDAAAVAERILATMAQPFDVNGREVRVTTSIGITFFPHDADSAEVLLKNADMAMYRAKESGRNNFQFYKAEMTVRATRRLDVENRLRYALSRRELDLHYQPLVDLASGRYAGLEALLRWRYDDETLLAPGDFLPILEETGLIREIGEWVVDEACRQHRAWQDAGLSPPPISVNVSPVQLSRAGLVLATRRALDSHGLKPTDLVVELTESAIMSDPEMAEEILRALTDMGVPIALDDFGTGYSSLICLRRFPISKLKLDRSFLQGMPGTGGDRSLVRAIAALGCSLGLEVVAEGVETPEQLALVRDCSCHFAQGFYLCRPLPPDELAPKLMAGVDHQVLH